MAETNQGVAAVTTESAAPKATDSGLGLADYGYSRKGYLDKEALDSLVVPIADLQSSKSMFAPKLLEYAQERTNIRNTRVEDNIRNYLYDDNVSDTTKNLYKDLYDSYKITNPNSDKTRETYIREMTNLSSKLSGSSSTKALDGLMADWQESPSSLLKSASALDWETDGANKWATSGAIGDLMGWDSSAYDRSFNVTGLEGFAEMSRTVKAREEAERLAAEEAARQAALAAQQRYGVYSQGREGGGDPGAGSNSGFGGGDRGGSVGNRGASGEGAGGMTGR